MFLTQLHARWLSRGHNGAYKLPCKPCSAQHLMNECQLQLARDSFNHNDTLCSIEASDSSVGSEPKASSVVTTLTLLHTPEKAAVTALNCCITRGFWRREAQSDLLSQHETNYYWLRGSPARNRTTGSPRKSHKRAMHRAIVA